MSYPPIHSMVLSLLPAIIPPYAFRLSRIFGMKRMGWMMFGIFSLLAVLQVVRSWRPIGLGLDPELTLDLLNFLVPVLLLAGMVHIEMVFKDRLRKEEEERRQREGLELLVKERTADLAEANADLEHEMVLRKQGEEALRRSNEQYRLLFDENPQPMWIYDLGSLRFMTFNAAMLRQYGYTAEEFRAMSVKDLCLAGEADAFASDSISTNTSSWVQARGLWHHRKKDGSLIEVEVSAFDLFYADCPARLVMAHDVTAQRLLQRQLLHSRKLEIIHQLANGVADRFGQLIAGIEEDANVLAQNCPDALAAERLKRIGATANSATGLTSQLLALVGRHPMRAQVLELNHWLESQSGVLARLLGKEIKVETAYRPQLPPITADPALLAQVLQNLVRNAREAMPQGGTLTLSTSAVRVSDEQARRDEDARPGTFVCLTVADTGCGMGPEVLAHLFEPFFTTKTGGQAAGLGLSTVYGLIKQHSGWIEVESQPGTGSQFSIFLPSASTAAPGGR